MITTTGSLTTGSLDHVFERVYNRVLFIPAALDGPDGRALNETLMLLHELPANVTRVLEVLEDDKSDAGTVALAVEQSPAIAAKVLKVVNSSYGGLRGRIANLRRAVSLLGYDNIRSMVLGMSLYSVCGALDLPLELDIPKLWRHSAAVGNIGRIITAKVKDTDGTTLLSAGLLHDIGKLIMAATFRERYARLLHSCREMKGELIEMELHKFGLTHPIAAAALCHIWNLPERLWGMVAAQAYPTLGPDIRTAACLMLAEYFARSYKLGDDIQWPHGFIPDEICFHLEISRDQASELIAPDDMRRVRETIEWATPTG